jgi:hypothetical protein
MANKERLDLVCHIPTNDPKLWDADRNFARQYDGFRTYSDTADGSFWIVTNDGTRRSALFYSLDLLCRNVDYILDADS